jgi:hypothetical protein
MKAISEIKQYHLTTEEIAAMLATQYGSIIKPIDQGKLQKQRTKQQCQSTLAANSFANDKSVKLAEELREKELEEMDDLINELL